MKTVLVLFTMFASLNANALWVLEPGIGYIKGGVLKEVDSPGDNDKYKMGDGHALSLKAGGRFIGAMFGLDTSLAFLKMTQSEDPSDPNGANIGKKLEVINLNLGFYLGFHLPILPINVWAGVGYASLTFDSAKDTSNNTDLNLQSTFRPNDSFSLTGWYKKVGVGFRPLRWVRLNAEYRELKFNKLSITDENQNTVEHSLPGLNGTTGGHGEYETDRQIYLSITVPLEFQDGQLIGSSASSE
jgi:hypothetical protein